MVALRKTEPAQMSAAEYIAWERQQETKHEFAQGEIVAMTGASWRHNLIAGTLTRLLGDLLACTAIQSDMRVQVSATGSYRYPDVVVVCDEPQFADDAFDMLTNPTLLVEVLSETSQLRDRHEKLYEYRQLPTLQAYILVSQDVPHIEMYARQDDQWIYSDALGVEDALALPIADAPLELAAVYENITFETAADTSDDTDPSDTDATEDA